MIHRSTSCAHPYSYYSMVPCSLTSEDTIHRFVILLFIWKASRHIYIHLKRKLYTYRVLAFVCRGMKLRIEKYTEYSSCLVRLFVGSITHFAVFFCYIPCVSIYLSKRILYSCLSTWNLEISCGIGFERRPVQYSDVFEHLFDWHRNKKKQNKKINAQRHTRHTQNIQKKSIMLSMY